jgi:uncharacterized protein YkwD
MKPFILIVSLLAFLIKGPERAVSGNICLRPEEQKLYSLLMEYRKEKGLESIPLSSKLTMVAQVHAKDLSENHDAFNGPCNLHSWSKKGKWQSCCYTDDHKESACMWSKPREIAGYQSNGYEISYYSGGGATAQESIDGWQESSGHNEVMINEGIWKSIKWNAIGIGIYKEYGVVWFGGLEDTTKPAECN